MSSQRDPRRHLTYANVMSTLAVVLMVAAGGAAGAGTMAHTVAKTAAKNSVTSKSIKDNTVSTKDVKDGSLTGTDVADNSLTGSDIDESTLTVTPKGTAGGGLTGSYPNPTIGNNAVGSSNVTDNSLTESDLGPGSVTGSELGTITRVESATPIATGTDATGITTCPAGQIALSGGWRESGGLLNVYASSKENVTEAWVIQARNASGSAATLTVFAYCLAA